MTFSARASLFAATGPQPAQPEFFGLAYWGRRRRLVVLAWGTLCGGLLLAAGKRSNAVEPDQAHRPQPIHDVRQPSLRVVTLTSRQQRLLDDARSILTKSSLSDAQRQLRLNAIEAVLTGTVAVPDDDNPEARNLSLWTETTEGYVVAANHTAAEAISDLWIVHDNDCVPIPRIWCYKYSSLIIVRAYIKYFQDTGNNAGLSALNRLIGHRVFPNDLTKQELELLWKCRAGGDNLLPGDQVWFENPYFDRGSQLIRRSADQQALSEGKPSDEAATFAAKVVESLTVGEEGSNVFYLGNNLVARGARSVVRTFRDIAREPDGGANEQVYTRKVFTVPEYQQHMIDDYFTVQACLDADPDRVHPRDFQIKQTRSFGDPDTSFPAAFQVAATQPLDRLIDALASRDAPPQLIDQGTRRVPRFAADYDWRAQRRVRAALLAVLHTQSDAMWWRLRRHFADQRYVLTASRNERARNFTVGEFCRDFFAADLASVYARHLPAVVGRLPAAFHPDALFWQNEQEWSRTQRPLYEIQIAICQQALQEWAAVTGTVAGDEGEAHTYTPDEKARFVEAVTKEIDGLRQTRRAVFLDATLPGLAAPSGWEGFDEPGEPNNQSGAGQRAAALSRPQKTSAPGD